MIRNSIKKFFEANSESVGPGGEQKPQRENSAKGEQQVNEAREKHFPSGNKALAVERIKQFRRQIDSLYLTVKELSNKPYLSSREMSLAVTCFQSARQFAGKVLQALGTESPYTPDNIERKDVGELLTNIVRTSATTEDAGKIVLDLRNHSENIIKSVSEYIDESDMCSGSIESCSEMSVLQGLMAGKMWLGELYAILMAPTKAEA